MDAACMCRMKLHLNRLTGILAAALSLALVGSTHAAPDKKAKKSTPAPTDQFDAARAAIRKQPGIAVDATFKRDKFELHLKVRLVGDDWEMVIAGKQPLKLVRKDGKYFVSEDDGKTWRPTTPDDDLVSAVLAPLEEGQSAGGPRRATYEAVGKEKVDGVDLLHLRMVPEPGDKTDANDLPQVWLAPEGHNGWIVRRSRSTETLFKQAVTADVTYEALPKDATIPTPEVN